MEIAWHPFFYLACVYDDDAHLYFTQLPRDGLETVSKEINFVNGSQTHVIEEGRLRPSYVPAAEHESTGTFAPPPAPPAASSRGREEDERAGAGAGGLSRQEQPWFARNIVDHRCAALTGAAAVAVCGPARHRVFGRPPAGGVVSIVLQLRAVGLLFLLSIVEITNAQPLSACLSVCLTLCLSDCLSVCAAPRRTLPSLLYPRITVSVVLQNP